MSAVSDMKDNIPRSANYMYLVLKPGYRHYAVLHRKVISGL